MIVIFANIATRRAVLNPSASRGTLAQEVEGYRMFEDMVSEKATKKFGSIKRGDVAVMSTSDGEIGIVYFHSLHDGPRKKHFMYERFIAPSALVKKLQMSWKDLESNVVRLDVLACDFSPSDWSRFITHYKHMLLIQKAEQIKKYHLAGA